MYERIAIFGRRRAGKSTVAGYLQSQYGYSIASVAAPMRDMLRAVIAPENQACLDRDGDKERPLPELGGCTTRDALKFLGTEWGVDMIWKNIWVHNLISRVQHQHLVVVDDCRRDNEFETLRKAGFTTVLIDNPRITEEDDTHATESDWQAQIPDVVITNDGDLQDLQESIMKLLLAKSADVL